MIHYFNPGHETAILNGSKYYMAPANVVIMQNDLSFLPAWYSQCSDYVLIDKKLPDNFQFYIQNNFGRNFKTITLQDISLLREELINQEVSLWGITPQAIHFFETINNEFNLNLSIPKWDDKFKTFCDRHTSQDCLRYILNHLNYLSKDIIPTFFDSLEDIESYISKNNEKQYLAKAPFSSSGRGLLWLPKGELTRTERQILHGHLKKQGYVSLEIALNKKIDFAMEFHCTNKQVVFKGYSLFKTNEKGAYLGNCLSNQNIIKNKLNKYIDSPILDNVQSHIQTYIRNNIAHVYEGFIGIDMLIYSEDNIYKLHPCLEINVRNNMGIIALNLSQDILDENSSGYFHVDFNMKNGEILKSDNIMKKELPTVFKDNKLQSGYLSLCPISEQTKYRAYIIANYL